MPIYIKDILVVLGLSIPLFAVAKSTALLFMDKGDFRRRRNAWLILTTAAFLSPNFWLFAAVAAPVLYFGGRKDTNPIGFYLLLMNVIPSIVFQLPAIAVNRLFGLDIFRLLSFCVLLPAISRIRSAKDRDETTRIKVTDIALLSFGALQVLLFVPPDLPNHVILQNSVTNDVRTTFLFLVDTYALYYLASRSCSDRKKLQDALAAYCLSCSLMAIIAIFEAVKHWLLYTEINARWGGNVLLTEYYVRGSLLRAQASSGQPLALGFLLVIGFGFWLYLQSRVKSAAAKITGTLLLCAGLLVTFSRGPWLAAILLYFTYAGLSPGGLARLFKAAAVVFLLGSLLVASPLGTKISGMIPFMGGKVGESTLTYRERLLDRSLELIKARPIFGDQLALSKMDDLRQGQGIIDVVNAYVSVTLFYGFAGLALFLTFILSALVKAYRISKRYASADLDFSVLGANLAAAISAILVLLADGSLGTGAQRIFYVLIGLTAAYTSVHARQNLVATRQHSFETREASLHSKAN